MLTALVAAHYNSKQFLEACYEQLTNHNPTQLLVPQLLSHMYTPVSSPPLVVLPSTSCPVCPIQPYWLSPTQRICPKRKVTAVSITMY